MPSVAASVCLDEEELLALSQGRVSGVALERIETHLKDCADCRAVLAEAARALQPNLDRSADEAPTTIARYQVEALLGAGASGIVYRAFDPQLKRPVALKLLRPEVSASGREPAERLLREAQAMARLADPHVVRVYDVGLHQGMVYLVMEFIDGLTLSAWLRSGPRSLPEILRIFTEAGRGLYAAHQKGLVHRDFKPENVLVAQDGRALVTDFGLARESESWLAERQTDDQASTELYAPTRGLVGTPAYMSPELFEGGRAGAASDQFAFCVALFVALFEKHPFKAGEGIGLSELVTRVRGGTLQEPTVTESRRERVLAVLRRGLAPSPAARYADLAELLFALERASRTPRRGQYAALATLLLAVVAAGWAFAAGKKASAPVLKAAPRVVAPSAPVAPPSVESSAPARSEPKPAPPMSAASPSVRPARPTPAPGSRRDPKPAEVRYKDWLKDPF